MERLREDPAAGAVLGVVSELPGVYLVGGAIRDALLGATPEDLDFVVEGEARDVAAGVAEKLGGELREYDRFGTARVSVDDRSYDFASARAEHYEHPGALPDVRPAPIEEDLQRRDFSVNAMALSTGSGDLVATTHSLEDVEARRLRVLHDASFEDDPTRLVRLARYAGRLRFEVESHTAELFRRAVNAGALDTVSGSRMGQELRLAAREKDPIAVFGRLSEMGLLHAVHPRLSFEQDFAREASEALPPGGRPDLIMLASAMRAVASAEAPALTGRLAFDREETRIAVGLTDRLPVAASALAGLARPSEIDAVLSGSTPEEAALIAALGAGEPVRRWLGELRHVKLEIDGADLRAAGVPEGPAIGAGLAAARAGRLDDELMTREVQLAAALRMTGT